MIFTEVYELVKINKLLFENHFFVGIGTEFSFYILSCWYMKFLPERQKIISNRNVIKLILLVTR